MKEVAGKALLEYYGDPNAVILLATCVMGNECLLEAAPDGCVIDHGKTSGSTIKELAPGVCSFPLQPRRNTVPDLTLIAKSARQLGSLAMRDCGMNWVLARPGVGINLSWRSVKRVLNFLPDNVLIVER